MGDIEQLKVGQVISGIQVLRTSELTGTRLVPASIPSFPTFHTVCRTATKCLNLNKNNTTKRNYESAETIGAILYTALHFLSFLLSV